LLKQSADVRPEKIGLKIEKKSFQRSRFFNRKSKEQHMFIVGE
jgi:hypothetical protein